MGYLVNKQTTGYNGASTVYYSVLVFNNILSYTYSFHRNQQVIKLEKSIKEKVHML